MSVGAVKVACDGVVARVTLDRPPLNVLNLPMLEELEAGLDSLSHEAGLKVVLLQGAGKAFSAGVDVADHVKARVPLMLSLFHRVLGRLAGMEAPVVAAVHGPTLGGGLELALAADVVLAREDARLGQPEIALAAFPPWASVVLPRLVGRQRAMDLILSGRTVNAEEALRLGLVSRVLPLEGYDSTLADYVRTLAGHSGPVLRLAKRAVRCGGDLPHDEALTRIEGLYINDLMSLADPQEGIAAFMARRRPVWQEA